MSDEKDNPFQFWQELKRRRVIRVMVAYFAAAFIIIQLTDIITKPFGLPDWTLILVIIILVIGLVLTFFLTWAYEITPDGIRKTKSLKNKQQTSKTKPNKKRQIISDIIIGVLLVAVIIMAYPKIFKKGGDLKAMTNTITVVNEFGEEEQRQVFKEEYVHKLAVIPFTTDSADSLNNWLSYGLPLGIYLDALQFNYIDVPMIPVFHLQEQIQKSEMYNCPYFLTGTFNVFDSGFEVTTKLYQTSNGSLKREKTYNGSDLFGIIDSISIQSRLDIGVQDELIKSFNDLPFAEHVTKNINAYRYYILGAYNDELSSGNMYTNYVKALEEDSTFAMAAYDIAWLNNLFQDSRYGAEKYIKLAMRHRHRLDESTEIWTRTLDYQIKGDAEKAVALAEMQLSLHQGNIQILRELIDIYHNNFLIEKAIGALERLNDIVKDYFEYQIQLAESYLLAGNYTKGLKYVDKRIKEKPDSYWFHYLKGRFLIHLNDLDNAQKEIEKAIMLQPDREKEWTNLLYHIEFKKSKDNDFADFDRFGGRYISGYSEQYYNIFFHDGILIRKPDNNKAFIFYPLSDTNCYFSFPGGYIVATFHSDSAGKVIKMTDYQSNLSDPYSFYYWRQDSLIQEAQALFESQRNKEAMLAFQSAYTANPEHYYLENYIKHLEFIQSKEYTEFEPFTGSFQSESWLLDIKFKENELLLEFNKGAYIFVGLHLNKSEIMNPSALRWTLETVREDNQIIGLNCTFLNSDKTVYNKLFLEKIN